MKTKLINKKIFQNRFSKKENISGFTLIEILISVFIFSMIVVLITGFQSDVFKMNRYIQTGLQNQYEAKKIIRPFSNEVRAANPSVLGTYPIEEVTDTSFIFYSDVNGDGLTDRVRYFLDGTDFKKGVISPSGNPLVYNSSNEKIINVIHDVVPQSIFAYFNSDYDGTSESTPLDFPISPSAVRLVKITIIIDSDPNNLPDPMEVTTQVSIRSLKDNR